MSCGSSSQPEIAAVKISELLKKLASVSEAIRQASRHELFLSIGCAFAFSLVSARAGSEVSSTKDKTAPPPCPSWYHDREWNINLSGFMPLRTMNTRRCLTQLATPLWQEASVRPTMTDISGPATPGAAALMQSISSGAGLGSGWKDSFSSPELCGRIL
jgi:hypothetical protein